MASQPKDPADYKLIGREGRLRVDAVPKILGATRYTIDVSRPRDADGAGAAPAAVRRHGCLGR